MLGLIGIDRVGVDGEGPDRTGERQVDGALGVPSSEEQGNWKASRFPTAVEEPLVVTEPSEPST